MMGAMSFDDRHTDRVERRARDADFEAALAERYRRLSLLTLDLAEEAGEAAVNFSLVDTKGVRPAFFDRRLAAMTRAIWAHRVIERLRGRPAAKAATLKSGAKAAQGRDAGGAEAMQPFPDDGWTPCPRATARFFKIRPPSRPGRGESEILVGKECQRDIGVRIDILDADATTPIDPSELSRHTRISSSPLPTRHGLTMASMVTSEKETACSVPYVVSNPDEKWTPRPRAKACFFKIRPPLRPGRGESDLLGEAFQRNVGVRGDQPGTDEAALIDSIKDHGRGLGAVIDALAGDDLAADDFGANNPSPARHGLTMASMSAAGKIVAGETQSPEPFPEERWTPRSSRGESEIVATDAVEKTTVNPSPTRHGPAAKAANGRNSEKAASLRASAPSRAGMASMMAHRSAACVPRHPSRLTSFAPQDEGRIMARKSLALILRWPEGPSKDGGADNRNGEDDAVNDGAAVERCVNDGRRAAPP